MSKKLKPFMTFPALSLPAVALLGMISPTIAQTSSPIIFQVFPGQPDLAVIAQNSKPIGMYSNPRESSLVTISVQNHLTIQQGKQQGSPLRVFGSEVQAVLMTVAIPIPLSQIGGLIVPKGFMCGIVSGNHNVICFGGPIGAGGSVDFGIEVISEDLKELCGERMVYVQAEVDPGSAIAEVSETNNAASTGVVIYNIC
jgi:hypothetical protein